MPQFGQMEKRDLNTGKLQWNLEPQDPREIWLSANFKKFMLKSVQNLKLPIQVSASISYGQETEKFIQ